jgi:ubiquinone/menaquinone biosynthesis C-methylase UbiE
MTDKENYWSRFAEGLEEKTNYVVGKESFDKMKAHIAEQKDLGNTLELGCGDGAYTIVLINNVKHLTATDNSDEMLDQIRKLFKNEDKLTIEKADCKNLPYEEGIFDTVFMGNLLHVIDDPNNAALEARRVLKPGGRLIVISFTPDGMEPSNAFALLKRFKEIFGEPSQKKPMGLRIGTRIVKKAGFTVEAGKIVGGLTKAFFISAIIN